MERNQNITLSLPHELLRQIKRLAAERDTSVSGSRRQWTVSIGTQQEGIELLLKKSPSLRRQLESVRDDAYRRIRADRLPEIRFGRAAGLPLDDR